MRRDVAEDTQKALDSAQEAIKGFFTEETWNVSDHSNTPDCICTDRNVRFPFFFRPQKVVDSAKELGTNLKKVADDVVQKVSEKTSTPAAPVA